MRILWLWLRELKFRWRKRRDVWYNEYVQQKWEETLPAFAAPFTNSDQYLSSLEEPKLYQYLSGIAEFVKTEAYEVELESVMLRIEKELALRSQSDTERAGYRSALIFLRDFKKRLLFLANKFNELDREKGRSLSEQIKNI
jgi:hypothetical protein